MKKPSTETEMNHEYMEQMSRIYDEWKASGESLQVFMSEREDVTYEQFSRYRRKYHADEIPNLVRKSDVGWSQLNLSVPLTCLDVHVGPYKVVVPPGFDALFLKEVLEALRS